MKHLALLLVLIAVGVSINAQGIKAINNNISNDLSMQGSSHNLFKLTFNWSPVKGASLGLGYGMWQEYPWLQYSLNTACMLRIGKGFLGNYRNGAEPKDSRSRSQFVFMFSPILTSRLNKADFLYQEIEPFYFGTPNSIFSKFSNSLSLGTTFTISPRGTYKNVTTLRNRAQQDFLISLNIRKFNFTLYDDFFPLFTDILQLGDNWDRFFTGGGFIRYRFNDEYTFHLYSEVYTGINRSNPFLYPDIISYRPAKGKWKRKNYAHQDAGQEYFNSSWLIANLSYTSPRIVAGSTGVYTPNFNFFIGSSAPWTMFSQNVIHSLYPYDKKNNLKLHYFLPRNNVPGNLEAGGTSGFTTQLKAMFFGGGANYNILTR